MGSTRNGWEITGLPDEKFELRKRRISNQHPNLPYFHGFCEQALRPLRQPRHRVVDGRILAELAEEVPHHRRLQVVAIRFRLKEGRKKRSFAHS